ncbi:unnamed protein product [Medioppia subpectinata]|uniref:G-protein coupled receptors family 1 profile domain-containing protein n=1 Tax=Medioppia subpectinata TaxID=1979941 RepID=A0A7R9KYZ2_9ACAR|nr:unnamed protein product [Medioppia subpectinata]CAG2111354.1 unnamed protein product [Medioppia subpectinata]
MSHIIGAHTVSHRLRSWHDFTESRCIETWPTPRFWHSRRKQCVTSNTYKQLYYSMVTIALFFIPVLVMAVKMVCLVLLVFVISWMPLQIIVLYSQFGHSSHDSGELPQWFSWLSYVSHFIAYGSSAINPIIYGGFNQNFRHAFQGHQSFGTNMTAIKTNCNHKF